MTSRLDINLAERMIRAISLGRFWASTLGCGLLFGVYVAKLSPWLSANRVATYGAKTDSGGSYPVALNRDQVLLVMLALAEGNPLTPVQVQKSLFLADDKARGAFHAASRYDFQPYDYGPFDRQVYIDAQSLSYRGLAEIGTDPKGGWNTYAATDDGVRAGKALLTELTDEQRAMLVSIVKLVRSLSFTELVSAIYRRYPAMRVRSVFRD